MTIQEWIAVGGLAVAVLGSIATILALQMIKAERAASLRTALYQSQLNASIKALRFMWSAANQFMLARYDFASKDKTRFKKGIDRLRSVIHGLMPIIGEVTSVLPPLAVEAFTQYVVAFQEMADFIESAISSEDFSPLDDAIIKIRQPIKDFTKTVRELLHLEVLDQNIADIIRPR